MQDWDTMVYSQDGTTKGSALEQYFNLVIGAFDKQGICTRPGPRLEEWFREAGFVDVHVKKYLIPMGAWPKDKHLVCFSRALQGFLLTVANE